MNNPIRMAILTVLAMGPMSLISGIAQGQSNTPINLQKLSGRYACVATEESLKRYQMSQEKIAQALQKSADAQAAMTSQETPDTPEATAASTEAQAPIAMSTETPAPVNTARPPSRNLAVRVVVQSSGYPILSVENEELQGMGRAVQLRNKITEEVTFLLNFAALADFALHFEKAIGPVKAQLWRTENDGSTSLFDYACDKK